MTGLWTLLALTLGFAQEGEEVFGARYRPWLAGLSGHARADGTVSEGTTVDVESTFDFDSSEAFHDFSAWVNIPVIPILDRITAGIWLGEFQEEATVDATFKFGDQTFAAGERIDTELEFHTYSLSLECFLLKPGTDQLGVAFGIQLGARLFDIFASVTSKTTGFHEEADVQGPLPVVGVRLIAQVTEWLRLEADLVGVGGDYGGVKGSYLEGAVEAAATPLGPLLVGAGYKFSRLDVEHEDFDLDLTLDGFFLSAGVRF